MARLSRWIINGFVLSWLGLTACQDKSLEVTPIIALDRDIEVPVYVQGTVRDRAPLLDQMVYQLQDDTGKIWVMTGHLAPESGQTVTIQAKIRSKLIVLPQQQTRELYLEQMQQLP